VFCRPDGQPLYHQLVHNRWNDLLGVAGVTHMCRNCGSDERCSSSVRGFHTTRHTAATMLLERGVELEVVSAILGHSNIGMTAGVYAKVRSDLKRRRARPSRRPPALTGRSPQSRRPAAVDPGADGAGRPPELATARRSAVQLVAREMARQRGLDAEASARADFERCEFPSGGCRLLRPARPPRHRRTTGHRFRRGSPMQGKGHRHGQPPRGASTRGLPVHDRVSVEISCRPRRCRRRGSATTTTRCRPSGLAPAPLPGCPGRDPSPPGVSTPRPAHHRARSLQRLDAAADLVGHPRRRGQHLVAEVHRRPFGVAAWLASTYYFGDCRGVGHGRLLSATHSRAAVSGRPRRTGHHRQSDGPSG
jgi:hypothetical protein